MAASAANDEQISAEVPSVPVAVVDPPTDDAADSARMNEPTPLEPTTVAPDKAAPAAELVAEDTETSDPSPPLPRYRNFLSALAFTTPPSSITDVRLHPDTDRAFETHTWTTPNWPVRRTRLTGKSLLQFKHTVVPRYHQYFNAASKDLSYQERDRIAGQLTVKYLQLLQNGMRMQKAVRDQKARAKAEGEMREKAEQEWASKKGRKGKGPQGVGFPMQPVARRVKRMVQRVIKPDDPDWWSESEDEDGTEEGSVVRGEDDDYDDVEEEVVFGAAERRRKKGKERVVAEEIVEEVVVDCCAGSRERVAGGEGTEQDMREIMAMYEWLAVEEGRAT